MLIYGVDNNLILTACLLANCKKIQIANDLDKIKAYAYEGAQYLASIGFDERFCKICEGLNRYHEQSSREKESDILELVDHFGAMLLDRPERIGMEVDEALVLLEYRNLKNVENQYLKKFVEFIQKLETITIKEHEKEMTLLKLLVKMYRETGDVKRFITAVVYEYEARVDEAICKERCDEFFKFHKNRKQLEEGNPYRPLFSEETTKKIIGQLFNKK